MHEKISAKNYQIQQPRPSLYSVTDIAYYQAVYDPSTPLSILKPDQQDAALVKIAEAISHIRSFPEKVMSRPAILNYQEKEEKSGYDYLYEAKLLIVGEPGAGKTSLAKKILDKNYQLQPSEPSTRGIEVLRWNFPAGVRIKRDGKENIVLHDYWVNIWDFGGQEIYYATHQFFLTPNSLYTLVIDDRKEDTNFDYWLQVVELLSDSSPLLIVQNEKHDRRRDINPYNLQARFPSLKGIYWVNLETNHGLSELIKVIKKELELLPHIGMAFPQAWKHVRQALEEDSRNYISINEYSAICKTHGIENLEDKLALSSTLYSLGICLHFQDDPVLKSTIILKPKWCTVAVYRVLDDHIVICNHGRFSSKDLVRIWLEDEYALMRDELLRLMMKFQLCYKVPEDDTYIAVQLLSPTQPNYDWDKSRNLILRYQ